MRAHFFIIFLNDGTVYERVSHDWLNTQGSLQSDLDDAQRVREEMSQAVLGVFR